MQDENAILSVCAEVERLVDLGERSEAISALDAALCRYGDHHALLFARADVHARAHRFDLAVRDCARGLELRPSCAGYFNRGRWLLRARRFAEAVDDLTRVLEEPNEDLRQAFKNAALLLRGFCWIELKNYDAARADAFACKSEHPFWALDGIIDRRWLLKAADVR